MKIDYCPGCLKPSKNSYCKSCTNSLFNGIKINHVLNISRPDFNSVKLDPEARLSISGIQIKHSLRIENKSLILCTVDGEYILKPIPNGLFVNLNQMPANEHLTMQIAKQVYNINTAHNAIIFFADLEPAYITKRFDREADGTKLLQEDFAQLSERSEENFGKNYKYDFTYEEIAELIVKFVKSNKIELEKYFKVLVFNYLFSNGDAHLKNFSLIRNLKYNDYLLTPFYDLINTSLHIPGDSEPALDLFKDNYVTESYKAGSKLTKYDFIEFANKIGINESRFNKLYNPFLDKTEKVEDLIDRSFLSKEMKLKYFDTYKMKLNRLIS